MRKLLKLLGFGKEKIIDSCPLCFDNEPEFYNNSRSGDPDQLICYECYQDIEKANETDDKLKKDKEFVELTALGVQLGMQAHFEWIEKLANEQLGMTVKIKPKAKVTKSKK